jgi:hypothetical protein
MLTVYNQHKLRPEVGFFYAQNYITAWKRDLSLDVKIVVGQKWLQEFLPI